MENFSSFENKNKSFDKTKCFRNIRELLKDNIDVKIGQIEKEAGVSIGYMSRLEKDDNTAEPSVEFIVTAARLLKTSVDTLISYDITGLTPTEKYLFNFFEKLKKDTLLDKIAWGVESKNDLNNVETDINCKCSHPLFSYETFSIQTECGYPDKVSQAVYKSKSFEEKTYINGDCYNLRLKNGTTLYLMNISNDLYRTNDKPAFGIEAVIHVGCDKKQVIASTCDDLQIGKFLSELFTVVKDRMKHPQVNKEARYAIDAFMNDDLSDDKENSDF